MDILHSYIGRFPHAGWGGMFSASGAKKSREPNNIFGNGSAMRASPCSWAFDRYLADRLGNV